MQQLPKGPTTSLKELDTPLEKAAAAAIQHMPTTHVSPPVNAVSQSLQTDRHPRTEDCNGPSSKHPPLSLDDLD